MSLLDVDARGEYTRRATHRSWSIAGDLGRVQRDAEGNVYTYPAPGVTLVRNPVSKSNIIYRVNTDTGVMAAFAELPREVPEASNNPFGLLALTLDCEQNALYAASVYGSTPGDERGRIARVDLASGAVRVVKRDIDALSLAVIRDDGEKRLLVGSARSGMVTSFPIADDGSVGEQERIEIDLQTIPRFGDRKPRSLRVDAAGSLLVRAMPFEFTLLPRNEDNIADFKLRRAMPYRDASSRWLALDP
ncbi:MAG: hypothetical protein JNL19_10350 [Burkholderiales bacterium]|nr:hypothetical protein [Burkholderiales bacterium]